jgi:hypothetical protein
LPLPGGTILPDPCPQEPINHATRTADALCMRPTLHAFVCLSLVSLLGGGCLHYSQKSSSRSGQAGWGSGGGGAGAGDATGSSSGSGWGSGGGSEPRDTRQQAAEPQYGGVPTTPTGMAMDPSLGLWRMNDAPNVFYDGRAYYTKTAGGWKARLDPAQPWQPVSVDVIPPALRHF